MLNMLNMFDLDKSPTKRKYDQLSDGTEDLFKLVFLFGVPIHARRVLNGTDAS